MLHPPTPPSSRRTGPAGPVLAGALAGALALGVLSACGGELTPSAGGRAGPGAPVTRTSPATPPPSHSTAPGTPTTAPTTPSQAPTRTPGPQASSPTKRPQLASDDTGRAYDLGVIVHLDHEQGVPVIIFDRWTAKGVDDATLARDGYPLAPHTGSPFLNINSERTYRIPVAPDATFTYQHCTKISQPTTSTDVSLAKMAALPRGEQVVLLEIDARGQATSVRNDPAC